MTDWLEELRRLDGVVTPGEWGIGNSGYPHGSEFEIRTQSKDDVYIGGISWGDYLTVTEARHDATLIALLGSASTRTAIIAQADELAALKAEVERLHAVVAAFNNGMPPMTTKDAADRVKALEAEVKRLREALLATVNATRAYLPPDGIDEQECINRILAATDNPEINPYILATEARAALGGEDAAD